MRKIAFFFLVTMYCSHVLASDNQLDLSDGERLEINEFFLTNGMSGSDPDGRVHGKLYQPKEGSKIMWLTLFIEWKEVAGLHPVDIVVLDPTGEKVDTHNIIVANSWFYHAFPVGFDLTKYAAGEWTFEAWEQDRLIGSTSAEIVERYEDLSFYEANDPLETYEINFYEIETDKSFAASFNYLVKINAQGEVYEVDLFDPTGYEAIDRDIREAARKLKFIPKEGVDNRGYKRGASFEIEYSGN